MPHVILPPVCPIQAPDTPHAQYAAQQLVQYLSKKGGQYPIVRAAEGFALRLVETKTAPLQEGAFSLRACQDGIDILAASPSGLVYGAYALMEQLGFGFFAPDCETLPEGPLQMDEGERTECPAFPVRELFWREAMDGAFAVKMRLNSARSSILPHMGGKTMFYNFSHTFDQLVPVDRWFDTHPEYFSMVDGVRIRERTQLCLTNPEVLRLCVEGVLSWVEQNPAYHIFSVAMNDWYNNCQCPACRAIDEYEGSGAGTMLTFVNQVAEKVTQKHPHVLLHTFAYLYCRKPPRFVRPHPRVIVRLCSIECCFAHPIAECGKEIGLVDVQAGLGGTFLGDSDTPSSFLRDLEGWAAICDNLYIWDYTTNYANYLLPFPNLSVLQKNLQLFARMGVKGVFEQGNFSLGRASALAPLKIYLLSKLLWQPDADVMALTARFAHAYYGPAGDIMLAYIALWQHTPHHASIYDMPDASYLAPDILEQAQQLLEKAALLASDAPYAHRIQREGLSLRYAKWMQKPVDAPGYQEAVQQLEEDARRLYITEVFERRDLAASFAALQREGAKVNRLTVPAISYPI